MTDKEKIIAYIDKLLEKYPKNYYLLTVAEFIDSLQEEPVSEDLEEVAKRYGSKKHPMTTIGTNESAYDFKAGAKWQAEQFEKNRLKHCDELTEEQAQIESDFVTQHLKENNRTPTFIDAIEYGMKLQKNQMIKGAVEAKVYNKAYPTEFEIETNTFMQKLKHGDKVKVIVIKED